jgi:hypothetical protein
MAGVWTGGDGQAVLDSPINNAFAHFLALMFYFAGHPADVSAVPVAGEAALYRAQPIETFDTASMRAETDTGVELLFHCSHSVVEERAPELLIEGVSGRAWWRWEQGAGLETFSGRKRTWPAETQHQTRETMLRRMVARLSDPLVKIGETGHARPHTRLIEMLHRQVQVTTIPGEHLAVLPRQNGRQIAITGVERLIVDAFIRGTLFDDGDAAGWTTAATRFVHAIQSSAGA